jgi:hypothetical protein
MTALGADAPAVAVALETLAGGLRQAKLPATASLGRAEADALTLRDYKRDDAATAAARRDDPNSADIMMFGKMTADDVGGMVESVDPASQTGSSTGLADVAAFKESITALAHQEPALALLLPTLLKEFDAAYAETILDAATGTDRTAGARWYAVATEIRRAARGEPMAAQRLRELAGLGGRR